SLRGNCIAIDEAISGYLTRLPRSLRLLAMTFHFFHLL
ncbi:hypothetical protein RAMDARK_1461, partial [Rickettsia amblyommatis str. Darkwater]